MDDKFIKDLLKRYIKIFISEYAGYLDRNQLETLRNINYDTIIHYHEISYPHGIINFNQIYLSDNVSGLINSMKQMPEYNSTKKPLDNKNYSSYLKYACYNGYVEKDFYADELMYLVFKLVIKNNSGLIDGLINQEVRYLSQKYHLRAVNLYQREEVIASKISALLDETTIRKLVFMDLASSYKLLNDKYGFRYAELFYKTSIMIDKNYHKLYEKDYHGYSGIIEYAEDYDGILYGNVYDYLLDFEVENVI